MSEAKKTILIVHNYYKLPGGEDRVVENEMALLKSHGHKVIFYERHNQEMEQMTAIKKAFVPTDTIYNKKTYIDIKKIIEDEKVDLVHVHNTLGLVSAAVYYAARDCQVPVVQTVHNFRMLCPNAVFYRDGHVCEDCLEKGLYCSLLHGCYRNSFLQTAVNVAGMQVHKMTNIYKQIHYICLTEFAKQKLLQQGQIEEEQIFIKPNFLQDPLEILASTEVIPSSLRKNQIIFAGRLSDIKGIPYLMSAWKKYEKEVGKDSELKLLIYGNGELENRCKSYIKKHDLKRVEIKDFIEHHDLLTIIGESKAVIFPSQCYEGMPMSILEAYAMGTPVIASDIDNVESFIQNGKTGLLFKHDDVSDLAEAIGVFERETKDFSEATREEYRMKYTSERNYELLMDIYNRLETKC